MKRSIPYLAIVALSVIIYVVWPEQLSLAARIATMAIFVMSLDLVVGYGGLATLGHSAMFGIGAYASGLLAMHLTGNPLIGLAAGAAAGAALAGLSGLFLLRYEGLTFLMLTVAVGQIVQNAASKLRDWTGGEDGLTGFEVEKLLGIWGFDLYGRVAFIYCVIVSTAIPQIHAKPIIDMLVEVKDITNVDTHSSEMEALGYQALGEFGISGRRYFRKARTHHIHSFEVGSPQIERHLAFRDYMIAHTEAAQEYSELKRKIAKKYPDNIQGYMDEKDGFIKAMDLKAAKWRSSP